MLRALLKGSFAGVKSVEALPLPLFNTACPLLSYRIDQTSRLLSVLGTVYKLHPTDWWHTRYHGIVSGKKSPQINKYTCSDSRSSCQWCAYTSYILLICWIIVKLNAINSLKYSPKIITKTFCHSDCCSICKLWAITAGHYLLIFSIIANKDAIKFVIFTKNLSNSRRKMVIAKARPSIGYCHSRPFVNLWMRLLYLCVILELTWLDAWSGFIQKFLSWI